MLLMLNSSCSSQDRVLLIFIVIPCEMVCTLFHPPERKIRTTDAQSLLCIQWLKITPFVFAEKYSHMHASLIILNLFFPTVISLSAHSILCMTEALPLPKYSQCLPLTCWPRVIPGRLLFRSQLSRLPSSCNGTCLLPCMSSWDQRNAALCAPGDATSSRGRNNETTVKLC